MSVKDFPGHPSGSPFESDQFQRWLVALRNRQNIDLQQELTSVDSADEVMIFDASETGPVKTKKATVANILALVTSGDMSYADTRFKVGSFTRDMSVATGTQAVTGVGFEPKFVFAVSSIAGGGDCMSVGWSDVVTNGCAAWGAIVTANFWFRNPYLTMSYRNAAGTNFYRSVVNSFDSDGFTIGWTKAGTPTGTITVDYAAFR